MDSLAQKPQKLFIASMQQVESGIGEDPIIRPIKVIDAMLMDIARRIAEAVVIGRQLCEVVEPREKVVVCESPRPRGFAYGQEVHNRPAGNLRNLIWHW